MIERIHIKNFRMLKDVTVDLPRFAVLVGKNSTGKTTLIKAIEFVADIASLGVDNAIERALDGSFASYNDLCFDSSNPIEFTIDYRNGEHPARYHLGIGGSEDVGIVHERLERGPLPPLRLDVPIGKVLKAPILLQATPENPMFLGDPVMKATNFGITRLNAIFGSIRVIELKSRSLRLPSPARSPKVLSSDGASLASAARALRERDLPAFRQWVDHVAGAVEGLEEIDIWDRPEDRASVLRAKFQGREDWVPSNFLSDGTLRLLALSLLAYAEKPDDAGIVLVEEPENGLHPLAMQYVFDALAGMEHTQVFVATHSPIFLAQATLDDALYFSRNPDGSASIVRGSDLAKAKGWDDAVRLETLFAAGVLS